MKMSIGISFPLHWAVARVIFLLFLQVYCSNASDKRMQFATQPTHQTAVLGSTVVLPCRVINSANSGATVQWTRDGFGLGTIRRLKGFERYSMIGSDEEGDFSLRISPVTLEDDSEYQCQVSSNGGPKLRSHVARLTVFVSPKHPTITPSPEVFATAGVNITVRCESVGGRPAPEIQWLDDAAGLEMRDGIAYSEVFLEDKLRVKAISSITFSPNRHHHMKTLTCLTHNPALNEPLAATVRLKVEYPPEIELILEPSELAEGSEARVICNVEANPPEVEYKWLRDGKIVADVEGSILNLGVLTRMDHGSPIACEVKNSVGTIRRTQNLNINYAPRFDTAPGSESAEVDAKVKLKCNVDANPKPEITWHHLESKMILGQGPEITVIATKESQGTYLCVVQSRGYSALEGRLHLRLRGPPVISALRSVSAMKGHMAELKCEATAVPHPLAITWMKNGAAINPADSNGRLVISEKQKADGVLSLLTINSTLDQDFTAYNCSVVNEYGIDVHQIILRRKTVVPVILIVGGGVGVIFIVLMIIIFITCSRRFRKTREEKSLEAGSDKSFKKDNSNDMISSNVTIVPTILKSDVTMLSSLRPTIGAPSDNDSDTKEADNRTTSSMSANDRESDHWEGSEKGMGSGVGHHSMQQHPHQRYSQAPVFSSPEQNYLPYVDYSRDYTPVPIGEGYAQFKLVGPYARSSPASEPPSSLPSSVAPPPYTPQNGVTAGITGVNGSINGLTGRNLTNGRLLNGSSNGLRHDLIADLQHPDLTREVSHRQEITMKETSHSDPAMHTKFILPPQANLKPGTLV